MTQWMLLRSRQFLPHFISQFLGACNDNIFKNALIILIVFQLADSLAINAQFLVALASGLFILPFFVLSITAGQIADKYCKSKLIVQMKYAEFLIMLGGAIGFYTQNIPCLMVILLLLGIQATFFGPLKYAILPELLMKEDVIKANGLIGAATFLAILIGTILGGILIMRPAGRATISGIVVSMALLGCLSAWLIPTTQYTNPAQPVNGKILQEIRQLLMIARRYPLLFFSIIGISWFWLFGATILAILPPFTKTVLQGDETVVTFLMAIFSIGIAIGSLLYAKIAQIFLRSHIILVSLLGMSVCTLDLGWFISHLSHHSTLLNIKQFLSDVTHFRVIGDACGLAIFGGLYTVPLYTLIQTKTPTTHRARMIALNNIMNALFMIISALSLMGLTSMGYSPAQILAILTTGSIALTAILYFSRAFTTA